MADTGSDARSGIGARLRAGREKMGLTQLQAAEKLHVDPKVVENLEADRFDLLGAPVFVRGHLKHYAELIGEQGGQLLELYAAATKPVLPDLTRLPKAAPDSNPSRLAVPALVVLIAFVALGVVWWVVKSVSGPEAVNRPKRGPQPVAIAPTFDEDTSAVDSAEGASPAGAEGSSVPTAAAAEERTASRVTTGATAGERAAPQVTGVVAAGPRTGAPPVNGATTPSSLNQRTPAAANSATAGVGALAGSSAASTPAATAPVTTPAAGAAAAAAARGKPLEVTLRFTADSWVEVYDANGEKLFYDVGTAASSRTVSGTPPFRVTVANAPGVSLDVNGKPATVPANALKGDEAHFTISRTGRIARVTPQADGG